MNANTQAEPAAAARVQLADYREPEWRVETVELEFDLNGVAQKERGKVEDVYTADGAEFIRFASDSGPLEIRLDRIISMNERV